MKQLSFKAILFLSKLFAFSLIIPCVAFSTEKSESVEKITVAIAPFKNLMKRTDLEWMGEGFAETITTKLNYVDRLILVERAQINELMNELKLGMTGVTEGNALNIGKMLNADYLVIGSFQKLDIGSKSILKINTRLVNVSTRVIEHGKAAEAKGPYEKVFEIQESIAAKLANNLGVGVTDEELKNLTTNETTSVVAYELYNQAKNETDEARREKLLLRALEYDNNYAKVHLLLGSYYSGKAIYNSSVEGTAIEHLNKALELDYNLTEAHYSLGDLFYRKSKLYRRKKDPLEEEAIKQSINHFEQFIASKKDSKAKYYKWKVKKAFKKIKKLNG